MPHVAQLEVRGKSLTFNSPSEVAEAIEVLSRTLQAMLEGERWSEDFQYTPVKMTGRQFEMIDGKRLRLKK